MADTVLVRLHEELRDAIKVQAAKEKLSMIDYLKKIHEEHIAKLDS